MSFMIGAETELIPRLPLGDWIASFIRWLTTTFKVLFDFIKDLATDAYNGIDTVLSSPPFWIIALILAALAYFAKGWTLALTSLLGFAVIQGVDQWENAMSTLALVLLASVIAIAVGVPIGIWTARNAYVSKLIRPVLDFMQTMPAFVYLIPTVVIFRAGIVPGLIATIIFALAPGVRFTELGIRQVDSEVVEAGNAFGASSGRILRQIQLPLAMPTIMAGINQVIMLSLSMVVISGMVGAGGLGNEIVAALGRVNVGLGFEAGLAVVILAIYLDRITSALSTRSPVARAMASADK